MKILKVVLDIFCISFCHYVYIKSFSLIFKSEKGKLKALSQAVIEYHKQGRPVLIGSASITKNELID